MAFRMSRERFNGDKIAFINRLDAGPCNELLEPTLKQQYS